MCCEICPHRYSCANVKPSCYVPKPYVVPNLIPEYQPYIPYSPTTVPSYPDTILWITNGGLN